MRLTAASADQSAYILYDQALTTASGLDITFQQAQYGGTGADGISFFLKNGANTNTSSGSLGGGLGYSLNNYQNTAGIRGGLFGIGFDKYGDYSDGFYGGAGTPNSCAPNAGPGNRANYVSIRGGDTTASSTGLDGYCYLTGTSTNLAGADRSAAGRNVRIVLDPQTAPSPKLKVWVWSSGSMPSAPTLQTSQPSQYRAASTFKFGFGAGTGGSTDIHEVWGLSISKPRVVSLTSDTTVLNSGSTRVLTATIRDGDGNVDTTATDTITFAQADGSGSVTGLGTEVAASGVATLTVTGNAVGSFSAEASGNAIATGGATTFTVATPAPTAPTFTASSPSTTGTVGTVFAPYTFTASGTTPITFSVLSGSLPTGLALSSAGVLSGTPTAAGTYTFVVKAANGTSPDANTASITITITAAGGGGSSSGGGGSSTPVVDPTPTPTPTATATVAPAVSLDPIPNQANPNIPATGVPQGGSVFLVNGVPAAVSVAPNAQQAATALDISGPDFTMKLSGRGDDADPLGLGEKSQLILQSPVAQTRRSGAVRSASAGVRSAAMAKCVLREPLAVSSGTGFQAGSPVKMYILPSTYIGTLTADASGSYSGSLPVPAGVKAGAQTLQVNGFSSAGAVRSLSLGITVIPARVVTTKSEKGNVFFEPLSTVISPQGEATLNALVRKARKQGVRTVVVGFVQETATTSNDDSLSTLRARNVASYLRDRGLKGAYAIRGDGVGGSGDAARRVNVSVTYQSGC